MFSESACRSAEDEESDAREEGEEEEKEEGKEEEEEEEEDAEEGMVAVVVEHKASAVFTQRERLNKESKKPQKLIKSSLIQNK